MSEIILTTYPEVENEKAYAYAFGDDKELFHFVANERLEGPNNHIPPRNQKQALEIYFSVTHIRHCIITKQEYQSFHDWSDAVFNAAKELGWLHPLDFPKD